MDLLNVYNSDGSEAEDDLPSGADGDKNNHQINCTDLMDQSAHSQSALLVKYEFLNKDCHSFINQSTCTMSKASLNDACFTKDSFCYKSVCGNPKLPGSAEDYNIKFSLADRYNNRGEISVQKELSLASFQDNSSGGELTSQSTISNNVLGVDYFNLVRDENEPEKLTEFDKSDRTFFNFDTAASNKISSADFWTSGPQAVCIWNQPEQIWGVPSDIETSNETSGCHSSVPGNVNTDVLWKRRRLANNDEMTENCELNSVKLSCFALHHKIAPHLNDARLKKISSRCPKKVTVVLPGHSGTVNRINWCVAEYGHLLLSAAMDSTVRIWNAISNSSNPCVRTFRCHSKAVKDAIWSEHGKHIISCGFDKTARFCDVEQGKEVSVFNHDDYVTCVKSYPLDSNLFVTGLLDRLIGWDLRSPSRPIRYFKYKDKYGQVQDVCFLNNGTQFLSCADLVNRDSADRNIIVWDFGSGAVLSNQIFHERYTCTRLHVNPTHEVFLAQTHGNYIAEFSTSSPYRMNKCKRFEDHKVAGYGVGFDISTDGALIASGSADGLLYVYDHTSARNLRRLSTNQMNAIVLDVAWHPVLFSTVAASTRSGAIVVWQ